VTLAHDGTKTYSNAFEWIHRREAAGPNAIWQADHTPLDILLVRPDGEAAKPWLSTVIDDYSRAVSGYFLSFEDPSALHTSLALRQAIWRKEDSRWIVCGIPEVLYTDNGSDFTSQHLEQVGADLKIRLVFSTLGKPRGRGRIERFFSTVNEMFLCELDVYAPPGAGDIEKDVEIKDPTTLILVDEADRLRMASLEQVRAIFDAGQIGLILIGMPGLKNAWHVTRSSIPASASCMSFGHWLPPRFGNCWSSAGCRRA
jgi:transposase InsO family protein